MDYQIRKRRLQAVTHLSDGTPDDYGTVTHGTVVSRLCYMAGQFRKVKSMQGEEVTSSLQLYFDGVLPIKTTDQFIIAGSTYPVLGFESFPGLKPNTGTTVVYV